QLPPRKVKPIIAQDKRATSAVLGKRHHQPISLFSCFATPTRSARQNRKKGMCSFLVWLPRAAPALRDCPGLLSYRPYRTSVWLAALAYGANGREKLWTNGSLMGRTLIDGC